MKVKIKNYQAIKDAELEFVPGVNVIVGSTNNGKSSIIRAIQGAINNQGGSGFINYDAEEAVVTINNNEDTLIWTKSKKQGKSSYNINNEELTKIGQKQLPEVADLLNMHEVEVGLERFQINFWKQMEKPFLVDKTAYQLFDFISQSKEQEFVAGLQNTATSEFKELNAEVNSLNIQIDSLTKQTTDLTEEIKHLEIINDFDIASLEKAIVVSNNIQNSINSYETYNNEYYKIKEDLVKYTNVVDTCYENYQTIVDDISNLTLLENKISSYNKEESDLNKIAIAIKSIDVKINNLKEVAESISQLEKEVSEAQELYNKLNTLFTKHSHTAIDLEAYKQDIAKQAKVIKESEEALEKFDVCPLCGNNLDGHKH